MGKKRHRRRRTRLRSHRSDRNASPTPLSVGRQIGTTDRRSADLGGLRTFNANAFRGDGDVPQELCNLILAFALIFDDCRDVLIWHDELMKEAPNEPQKLNRWFGEHGGEITHTFRLLIGIVHELGEVIRKNSKLLNHAFFEKKILPKLSKSQRQRWQDVRSLAYQKGPHKSMDQLLKFLRDKTTYHYDSSNLLAPFERRFPSGASERGRQPLVSLGAQVRSTRFYFADAVAYDAIEHEGEGRGLNPLGPRMSKVLTDLMSTLGRIVEAFIQARVPWIDFPEDK